MESKVFVLFLLVCVYGQDTNIGEDNFSYPCDSLTLDCVRNYFKDTGLCTEASHEDGQPIQKDREMTYVPRINVTIDSYEAVLTFYGTGIEAFYINKDTNNLVMAVSSEGINLYSPRTNYYIDQRAREPLVVQDYVNNTYFSVLTAVIPSAGKEGIDGTKVSAYNTQAIPILNLGPEITKSSNPAVQKVYQGFLDDIPASVEELLLTKAPYFFYNYLQNYICDFGFEFVGEIKH
ncbi:hypothetical protein ABMA27_003278 [Loxostege sticticalis]|uniref:Uncharacterized protein n=1 Tax=Loxostege sticticalis TaxID=481309 RepID=A0ABR3HSL5_LOXSC